jgi:nitroreductase
VDNDLQSPLLHPLLASRWSPTSFDTAHIIPDEHVHVILEAARWAPSAGNSQPWAFIVGRRSDPTHDCLVPHLTGSSAGWAPSASLLVANLVHRWVEGTDWEYSEFSHYDLGQAVAHMTLQAEALSLAARQFRSFDRDRLSREFAVPRHWEITTMVAIGAAATANTEPTKLVRRPFRQRRSLADLMWPVP